MVRYNHCLMIENIKLEGNSLNNIYLDMLSLRARQGPSIVS